MERSLLTWFLLAETDVWVPSVASVVECSIPSMARLEDAFAVCWLCHVSWSICDHSAANTLGSTLSSIALKFGTVFYYQNASFESFPQ